MTMCYQRRMISSYFWPHNNIFGTGEPAWMFEQFILHKFNDSRLYDQDIVDKASGWTEIFGSDVAGNKDGLYDEYLLEMS